MATRADYRTGIVRMFRLLGEQLVDTWAPYQALVPFSMLYQDVSILTDPSDPIVPVYNIYRDFFSQAINAAEAANAERKDSLLKQTLGKRQVQDIFSKHIRPVQYRFLRRYVLWQFLTANCSLLKADEYVP